MKKVLVTGADGFIGSHLVEMLSARGYEVRALTLYNSFNNWGWLDTIPRIKNVEIVSGDVRDPFLCNEITKDIDTVFHLAALIAIPYSYRAPASYVDTNVNGTLNICKAALENKVSKVIHTSTSETYGTALYVPIDEKHPLQPQSPYSASKIAADAMAMSFHYSFGLPLVTARPFNTYGPRQSARAVIPTIISQIAAGKKEINLGDTSPTRDFNYVLDTCRGFIALAESQDVIGKTVNIGSNFEVSIQKTFEIIRDIMKSDAVIIQDKERIRPKNSEVQRLWCDNSVINKTTGFRPEVSLEKGLELTVEWFKNPSNLAHYKTDIYNV
ncbi:MAG TPA: NAD-dependent 4,6-dehydratase LegB [Bdellovibrio sp.]|uniref:NAD-dependent 4,6-dehydratase LegB n=1 Tax=Bdellovibrio sp. TaxID=28201 RepID=UPI002EDEF15E